MRKSVLRLKRNKGASTIEYIIMVTAVISVLVVFFSPSGPFSKSLLASYSTVTNQMTSAGKRLNPAPSPSDEEDLTIMLIAPAGNPPSPRR